jgi:hypothetical protein
MSLLLASIAQNSVQLYGGESVTIGFVNPMTASIEFTSAGGINGLTDGVAQWQFPGGTGVGASYEIFATRTAGTIPDVGTMDTWEALSSNRTWSNTLTVGVEKTSTLLIKIRETATGAILSQASYLINVENIS